MTDDGMARRARDDARAASGSTNAPLAAPNNLAALPPSLRDAGAIGAVAVLAAKA